MRALYLVLVTAGLAFAQLDSDTIVIQSSGPVVASPPGMVTVGLSVATVFGTSVETVLGALAETGASERELVGVNASGDSTICGRTGRCSPALRWDFQLSAPVATVADTLRKLKRAQVAAPSTMNIYFSLASGGASDTPECAYPTLISQARRHAETVAAAAGLRVGRLTALSDGHGESGSPVFAVLRVGDFSLSGGRIGSIVTAPPPLPADTCTVNVQFQVLR